MSAAASVQAAWREPQRPEACANLADEVVGLEQSRAGYGQTCT
jgi:hypothetical protein